MKKSSESLPLLPGLWRGFKASAPQRETISTGLPALDELLPHGGWPLGALTEILIDQEGIGELRLVMPALAKLSQGGRWLTWIAPPYVPYAPALAAHNIDLRKVMLVRPRADSDQLWAVEQALRSGTCGAVLAWPSSGDKRQLRRLQLAAESGNCLGLLFRSVRTAQHASPAALRLRLHITGEQLEITPIKCQGGWPKKPIKLALPLIP